MAVTVAEGYAAVQWLGRTYGATRTERHRRLPGDSSCPDPQIITTHAISIDAPPERVWPWLVQMGWGRGQWYTARWVDRLLFPANGPSADRIVPELQRLAVGDRILDGPPEAHCAFVVEELEPQRHLVLHSREHLPPGWAERFGAAIDWSWAFVLDPLDEGRTRFVSRTRMRLQPLWVAALYWTVVVPADFVMSRQMLRGVKARAEATTAADLRGWTRTRRTPERPPGAPSAAGEAGGRPARARARPRGLLARSRWRR